MKKPDTFLSSIALRNFKAIRNSGAIKLTPLTVFIGNNGSGKSSVIEGLETLRTFVTQDIDAAMQMWRGIEHVRNKAATRQTRFAKSGAERSSKPIEFRLRGRIERKSMSMLSAFNERGKENELFVEREEIVVGTRRHTRDASNRFTTLVGERGSARGYVAASRSLLDAELMSYLQRWAFLSLWPQVMGNPVAQTRTRGLVPLAKDGSNFAEYLSDIRSRDLGVFQGIVETLKYVLPYADDIQPALTSELERTVYLQLTERDFKVPGWLLSSGTLRVLALLAVLRHPSPAPLILIEELENGLDPRTIHLIVEEIHNVVRSGRSQVIVTTHSPYLLDLLPLSSIVFVEREDGAEPSFSRPADDKEKAEWAKKFGPGQLYTMSRLSRRAGK